MKSQLHRHEKTIGRRRLKRNICARYEITESPLYKLTSIHKLSSLLGIKVDDISVLCLKPSYSCFYENNKNLKSGKQPRHIQEPFEITLRLHYRLAKLLDSIKRPEFLHSATKKRSNVTNATAHLNSDGAVVLMDIRKFYENTTYGQIKKFFFNDLKCSHDIARLLTTLCSFEGHLSTGSCLSPLLSYFAHRDLFKSIESLCISKNVSMTLYVDDLTLSGLHATRTLLYQIKTLIKKENLSTHPKKDAVVPVGKSTIITGVIRQLSKLHLRNRHHEAIVLLQDRIASGESGLDGKLLGRLAAANSIDPAAVKRLYERSRKMQNYRDMSISVGD